MRHTFVYFHYTLLVQLGLSSAWQSPGRPCPKACSKAGDDPSKWTDLHGIGALKRCHEPVLFDTALWTDDDPLVPLTLRTCTAADEEVRVQVDYSPAPFTFGKPSEVLATTTKCTLNTTSNTQVKGYRANGQTFRNETILDIRIWDEDGLKATQGDGDKVSGAAKALHDYLAKRDDCSSTIKFVRYVTTSSALTVLQALTTCLKDRPDSLRLIAQACSGPAPATWMVGAYFDRKGDISAAQKVLRTWGMGDCIDDGSRVGTDTPMNLDLVRAISVPLRIGLYKGFGQINEPIELKDIATRSLEPRAECTAIQVQPKDGCWALSQRCGITQKDLESYNPENLDCNNVQTKAWVCCSKGTLPDMGPKPNPDGSCATYITQENDTCSSVAAAFGITINKIKDYNKKTWGWSGCALLIGQKFCVSSGDPPMPAERDNAVCGPQKPGSTRPTDGMDLIDLNPCALNVCCNVWGQCGTTDNFCIFNPADTKNPGTTQPEKNSCVSSCGMNITNNKTPPEQFRKITYFEAWNKNRPCLHMTISDVPNNFTHIHFAFPQITADYKINITGMEDEFGKLKGIKDIKRIISFGGWAFSTEAPTYNIFREGVTDANRATLASNIAKFVTDNGLDGVGFDWEYPSAPDIPGIPPSAIAAGDQYKLFLQTVKRRLQKQTVSIAAPASYWYMKGFPIKDIAGIVDYIVYMTYDLHGQWDYGNKWSNPSCEEGNCLRSHINKTETQNSLAMITKAGVLSNKVVVGVASYGRSFYMEEASYISNAEIREIITESLLGSGGNATVSYDKDSDSDILVYGGNDWVSYMSDKTKASRTDWYKGLNFGGTSDWAVDLDKDHGDDGVGSVDPDELEKEGVGPKCDSYGSYDTLEKISGNENLQPTCAAVYALGVLKKLLGEAMDKYNSVNDRYDGKFKSYTKYLKNGLPDVLGRHMDYMDGPSLPYFDCHWVGGGKDWRGACPVPNNVRGNQPFDVWKITQTLRDSDGFYKDLQNKTGILQDWIEFYTYKEHSNCQPEPCNNLDLTIEGQARLKKVYDIPDPKDVVTKAMGNQGSLMHSLTVQIFSIGMGLWNGSIQDVVQSLAVPVFLVQNAIEGMEDAKELAAANGGLAIQTVVEDPSMAPFAVMEALSLGRLKTPKEYFYAAKFRTVMKEKDISALGSKYVSQDAMVQKIIKTCKK
ncbi:glycoside hydrolase [Paraphaeosphaeria sporulosa]|uniref:chitinase n=1 Tax=Paraphaeosphaeria sporulosa TaxID=1460663 RepID=A0A177BV51_9PLEO|nr:glycoside hydrolase [Paraphaeosphaeria sporulosa]OAF98601.1 glycoside hydrolase [Paraphaeosphaeria sporulosa]